MWYKLQRARKHEEADACTMFSWDLRNRQVYQSTHVTLEGRDGRQLRPYLVFRALSPEMLDDVCFFATPCKV